MNKVFVGNTYLIFYFISVDEESPSLFIWNEACILLLLTLYSEHRENFEKMRHMIVYDIIARKMCDALYNVTGTQCQSNINSLKKHYKKIVDHNATSGNDRATWPYFDVRYFFTYNIS